MVQTETKATAAVQQSELRDYELVMILSPEATDEAIASRLESVTKLVSAGGGAVEKVDRWGKKRLAYPIRHFIEGNYVLARVKMKPATSRELEANLRISEDVIRHLLVKL